MKFRINYHITDQGKFSSVLKTFSSLTPQQRANDAGPGVTMVGRWHNLAGRDGVAIVESSDLAAVQRWILKWNSYMDCDCTPVMDDEECAAVGQQFLAETNL